MLVADALGTVACGAEAQFTILNNYISIIASDVPGGNRILIIKIKAQHSALSKAIKNTLFK